MVIKIQCKRCNKIVDSKSKLRKYCNDCRRELDNERRKRNRDKEKERKLKEKILQEDNTEYKTVVCQICGCYFKARTIRRKYCSKCKNEMKLEIERENNEKHEIENYGELKEYCERLKLRMKKLPCGNLEVCFLNPKCPKASIKRNKENIFRLKNHFLWNRD